MHTWSSQATTQLQDKPGISNHTRTRVRTQKRKSHSRRKAARKWIIRALVTLVVLFAVGMVWVVLRGVAARSALADTIPLSHQVSADLQMGNARAAGLVIDTIGEHASTAVSLTSDPVWHAYQFVPFIGQNLRALGGIADTMSSLATQARAPFTSLGSQFSVAGLLPSDGHIDINELVAARPDINAANMVIQAASQRANQIDTTFTLPPVDAGVKQFRTVLASTASSMDAVRRASIILPGMVGQDGPRNYLLMFQNNAELRASGGIPGALALVTATNGTTAMSTQPAATDFPQAASSVIPLSTATSSLYSARLGTYMQDITLTPDFPTTAKIASAFWLQKYGQQLDGVVSFDPVGLSYILRATGPLKLADGETITSGNIVKKVLSTAYKTYSSPDAQDAYFREVSTTVFGALTSGHFAAAPLLDAFTEAAEQHRLLVWSDRASEESVLAGTQLQGTLAADTKTHDRLGVYFNDATGAKMDYYLRTSVAQASRVCYAGGAGVYSETVTLRSTAPANAATALPGYVTGGGLFGVTSGDVKTRVVVYGPNKSDAISVKTAGKTISAASGNAGTRPVLSFDVLLAPGQSAKYAVVFRGTTPAAPELSTAVTPQVVPTHVTTAPLSCTAVNK